MFLGKISQPLGVKTKNLFRYIQIQRLSPMHPLGGSSFRFHSHFAGVQIQKWEDMRYEKF